MGVFQKFNGWLNDRGGKSAHGGDAGKISGNAYYASSEAEQAYGSLRKPAQDAQAMPDPMAAPGGMTGRTQPVDRFTGDASDKYGGRVPYRSQKDMQAESDTQRQQMEDQQRRQQAAAAQQKAQQFGRGVPPQAQPAYGQPSNVLPFPGMTRGPEGNYYAHVEYVVLLRSRNECTKVIEYIKANASVFLNMEFIANDSERQRCVDMLSGAAYTLGCNLSKISQRGIYLISSPSVYVVIDPALQKFAAVPESQGYVRPDYANPPAYGAAAQPAYGAAQGGYATGARGGYAAQQPAAQGMGARTAAYGAQAMGARTAAYGSAQGAGYAAAQTAPYAAQQPAAQAMGARTAAYGSAQGAGYAGAQTAPYAAQQPAGAQGATTAQRRPGAPFGVQGAFVRSAEGSQAR